MPSAELVDNRQWEKTCSKCNFTYPSERQLGLAEFFPADKKALDRLSSWCKQCHHEKKAKYRTTSKEKYKARMAVNNGLAQKLITKPNKCSICSATGVIEGHHDDYNKPLEVRWVCISCHRRIHGR